MNVKLTSCNGQSGSFIDLLLKLIGYNSRGYASAYCIHTLACTNMNEERHRLLSLMCVNQMSASGNSFNMKMNLFTSFNESMQVRPNPQDLVWGRIISQDIFEIVIERRVVHFTTYSISLPRGVSLLVNDPKATFCLRSPNYRSVKPITELNGQRCTIEFFVDLPDGIMSYNLCNLSSSMHSMNSLAITFDPTFFSYTPDEKQDLTLPLCTIELSGDWYAANLSCINIENFSSLSSHPRDRNAAIYNDVVSRIFTATEIRKGTATDIFVNQFKDYVRLNV